MISRLLLPAVNISVTGFAFKKLLNNLDDDDVKVERIL